MGKAPKSSRSEGVKRGTWRGVRRFKTCPRQVKWWGMSRWAPFTHQAPLLLAWAPSLLLSPYGCLQLDLAGIARGRQRGLGPKSAVGRTRHESPAPGLSRAPHCGTDTAVGPPPSSRALRRVPRKQRPMGLGPIPGSPLPRARPRDPPRSPGHVSGGAAPHPAPLLPPVGEGRARRPGERQCPARP